MAVCVPWLFIGEWGNRSVTRLSRGLTPSKKDTVVVGFYVDNLRWAPDGSLFATGQGGSAPDAVTGCYLKSANCAALTTDVVRIDPAALTFKSVVHEPTSAAFT